MISSLDSKTRLLLGAGGLLLFIVGLKRSYRLEEPPATAPREDRSAAEPEAAREAGGPPA